ncbi:MAG: UvrD-helicase domain-containing protein, partial [bacterium]
MADLNPRQKDAVRYIDGPLLVLAGAGSGKTSVITRKIAYLIGECGIQARNIAAVTFTNKAAREMKSRVDSLVKGKSASGITISTFHNLGLNFIRRELAAFGFKPGFSIFDGEDSRSLLKELMIRDSELDTAIIDTVQNQISHWKSSLIPPEKALSTAASNGEQAIAMVYQRYNQALRAYNAVDFDDLIMLPTELLANDADIREKWQNRIRYLLVDEYQDTNSAQYQLIKLLVGARAALTVVGDDDQSIYAWRGAQPENLSILNEDFPHLKVIKLEQNYRSTSRILRSANQLISNNPHLFEKKLWSDIGVGEPIDLIRCNNEDDEAERVVNEIMDLRVRKGLSLRDFAILYRSNHQARILEIKLQALKLPYQMSGGTSFFSRTEIKDIMAYLRLLVNPDDDNAFLRIINTPRRSIGSTTLEKLGQYALERHIPLFQAIDELGIEHHIAAGNLAHLRKFKHWFENVTRNCFSNDPMSAIHEMVRDIDYLDWLHQNASSDKVAENRYKNVCFLLDQLANAIKQGEDDSESGIQQAIAKLVLQDLLERQEEESADDKIQLMTLHASKGLEFPVVFLVGVEEDILPHRNSVETGQVDEERRLAYVGITRAQRKL